MDDGDTNDKVSIPKIPWLKPRSYRHGPAAVAVLATWGTAIFGISSPGIDLKPSEVLKFI